MSAGHSMPPPTRPISYPGRSIPAAPATVLVSHPHQDHYSLLDEVPAEWPVHCGEATATLMRISAAMFGKPTPPGVHPMV